MEKPKKFISIEEFYKHLDDDLDISPRNKLYLLFQKINGLEDEQDEYDEPEDEY